MFNKIVGERIDGVMTYIIEHEGLKLRITELEPDVDFQMKESNEYSLVRFSDVTLKIEDAENYQKTVKNNGCFDVELSVGAINIDIYANDDRGEDGFTYGLMMGARNSIHYRDVLIEVNVVNY